MKEINVTISLYFEIKDAKMFGGIGEIGYCKTNVDLGIEDLSSEKIQDFAERNISYYAEMFKVQKENVKIISRIEYEENTEVEE